MFMEIIIIIPRIQQHIYKHIGRDIKNIKDYTNAVPDSIDHLQEIEEVKNIVRDMYSKHMGEHFTLPTTLKHINLCNILFCLGIYI